MKKHLSTWLVPVFFILWVFFVIGSFFAVQKPFSAANVLAVGRVLLDVIVAGWVVLVGLGLGTWILSRFFALDLSSLETLVFGTGLGLGILSLFVLGLGLLGL
ncbi:MAG: hypothetical protein GY797_21095, partial [Deltaproteobacteria bacterium]|nr:hypothetical protein [Deltaproteobacteria bacterium]